MFHPHHRPSRLVRVLLGSAAALLVAGPGTIAEASAVHSSHRASHVEGVIAATSLQIGSCGAGVADVAVEFRGVGRLHGIGRTTLTFSARATCVADDQLGAVFGMRGAYRTANGDRLFFRGSGSPITFDFNPDEGSFKAMFSSDDHITGGTGRFSHATGHLEVSYVEVFTSPELDMTATVEGSVRLRRGDRD